MRHARTQRRSRLRTVVATVVTVVAEAEAEEATAAGVAQATTYMGAPIPQHHCVLRGGMEVCHARTRGRFEGDGSNGVCLPTSSGREPGSGAANATPEEFKCWATIQGAV